jgi:Rieske Fe-S protein
MRFRVLEGFRQMTDVQTRTDAEPQAAAQACPGHSTPRRAVLMGAGALGATCFLAACGTAAGTTTNPLGSEYADTPAPAGSKGADALGGGPAGGAAKGSGGKTLAAVADVPEGGGVIKAGYVITQPSQGTFKAFSKVCTHQGCDVNKVDGGVISCPCHGSTFSIEDGTPQGGPAVKALPEIKVKVDGANVVTA